MGTQTPLKAIRRACLRCMGSDFPWDYLGVPTGLRMFKRFVADCPDRACPLWPFREGRLAPRDPAQLSDGGQSQPQRGVSGITNYTSYRP
jgi:hypothetical protein